MSIVTKVLGLFLGTSMQRDIKEINPFVEKTHIEFNKLQDLSNDQLRDRTLELKKRILDYIKEDEAEIASLRETSEKEDDVYKKEELYNEIDKIEKRITDKFEVILDESVPEAFCYSKGRLREGLRTTGVLEVRPGIMTGILLRPGKVCVVNRRKGHPGAITG